MSKTEKDEDHSALNALLDAERDALLAGDLDRLADLLPTKQALIEAISQPSEPDPDWAKGLNTKVRRNQHLLEGALEGIRAAQSRFSALQQMRAGMDTYGADGQKRQITSDANRSVERRA